MVRTQINVFKVKLHAYVLQAVIALEITFTTICSYWLIRKLVMLFFSF